MSAVGLGNISKAITKANSSSEFYHTVSSSVSGLS